VIRIDNGTEFVNIAFGAFLSHQGILHQTFFPDTPPQNGVAERKNRHILEVARSLMYTMNAPKFFSQILDQPDTFRILGMKSSREAVIWQYIFCSGS
jgi:hypothetical protein